MLQTIQGKMVYVVDLEEIPKLPVTWATEEEKPYVEALGQAIHTGQITEPGKYGISIENYFGEKIWQVFRV